jgi:hypothetical protein
VDAADPDLDTVRTRKFSPRSAADLNRNLKLK